jgi:hypothetical protein
MLRTTICLVLALQMLLPTAAIARLVGLGAAAGKPATPEENAVVTATPSCDKICCCTNKPGCRCCRDNDSADQESDNAPLIPSSDTHAAAVHCKCADSDPLNLDVQFFGHTRPACVDRFDPPQADTVLFSSETYLSAYLSIDPHPPRQSPLTVYPAV